LAVRHSDLFGPRSSRRQPPTWPGWRILLLLLVAVAAGGIFYTWGTVRTVVKEVSAPLPPEVAPEVRPAPVQLGQRVNVLVMGLDDDRLRSDAMLLFSADQESGKIAILQIPRDTRALIAGKGTFEKINSAYAYGVGDKRFPANLRALKTVEGLLGVQIHYTVVVDLQGFTDIISEIGGVTINVPLAMDYDDPDQNLHIHLKPGVQKLDGGKALEFVRWRHNNDGTGYPDGDLGRIRTQQQFLRTVLDELFKPANLPRLPGLAVTIARHVDTTMEPARLASLAKLAATLKKDAVEFATLPGTDAYLLDPREQRRLSFYLPDPEATARLVDRLVRGIDPKDAAGVRVEVAVAGATDGADRVTARLVAQGFQVSTVALPEQPAARTRVIDLRGDTAKAQLVGRSLTSQGFAVEAVSQPSGQATADVRVILGREATGR
jgi:polyisoprenyl-teichoic acid--peptidoglycan teichoic acid transferase